MPGGWRDKPWGGVIKKNGYDPHETDPGSFDRRESTLFVPDGVGKREVVIDRRGRLSVNEELLTRPVPSTTHNAPRPTDAEWQTIIEGDAAAME